MDDLRGLVFSRGMFVPHEKRVGQYRFEIVVEMPKSAISHVENFHPLILASDSKGCRIVSELVALGLNASQVYYSDALRCTQDEAVKRVQAIMDQLPDPKRNSYKKIIAICDH
jgi:hypothetical protein